jgi:hypothetical protein
MIKPPRYYCVSTKSLAKRSTVGVDIILGLLTQKLDFRILQPKSKWLD